MPQPLQTTLLKLNTTEMGKPFVVTASTAFELKRLNTHRSWEDICGSGKDRVPIAYNASCFLIVNSWLLNQLKQEGNEND